MSSISEADRQELIEPDQPLSSKDLKAAFDAFDRDNSKSIDAGELGRLLQRLGHHETPDHEEKGYAESTKKSATPVGAGRLKSDQKCKERHRDDMAAWYHGQLIKRNDKDKDGSISFDEFEGLLKDAGLLAGLMQRLETASRKGNWTCAGCKSDWPIPREHRWCPAASCGELRAWEVKVLKYGQAQLLPTSCCPCPSLKELAATIGKPWPPDATADEPPAEAAQPEPEPEKAAVAPNQPPPKAAVHNDIVMRVLGGVNKHPANYADKKRRRFPHPDPDQSGKPEPDAWYLLFEWGLWFTWQLYVNVGLLHDFVQQIWAVWATVWATVVQQIWATVVLKLAWVAAPVARRVEWLTATFSALVEELTVHFYQWFRPILGC